MRINSRKFWKILGRVWSAPKCVFKTFCTRLRPRCFSIDATHIIILLNWENQTKYFSYTTFPVKKINVGKDLKL
jgi:hypothetical protein